MNQFFQLSFWFDAHPLPFIQPLYWVLLAICLLALVLGFLTSVLKLKKYKNKRLALITLAKLEAWLYSLSIVGLILIFLKYQRVAFLGMRVWLGLWLLVWLVWLAFIFKYIFAEVPRIKKELEKKREFEKYLP